MSEVTRLIEHLDCFELSGMKKMANFESLVSAIQEMEVKLDWNQEDMMGSLEAKIESVKAEIETIQENMNDRH
jgi:peptidoglycan hydrolase CwlO-like protein